MANQIVSYYIDKRITKQPAKQLELANLQNTLDLKQYILDVVEAGLNFVNPIELPDGTVGLPALTFTSDTDNGLYRIGANHYAFSANGAKVLDVATTGVSVTGALSSSTTTTVGTVLDAGSGTVSLPSYTFTGDLDTGLYHIGANNVGIAANGVKQVDISTTTVSFTNGITIADAKNIVLDVTTGTKIGTATSQKLAFWNVAPDVQPTTAITAAAFVANTSGISDDTATFGGYTLGKVVAALKRVGILA